MKQYPHFLYVKSVAESTQNSDGSFPASSESWVLHSACREQPNGKGTMINNVDGKAILFSAVIHLPLGTERIAEGTDVLVSETESATGVCRIKGQSLKFDAGQLHCRLWV